MPNTKDIYEVGALRPIVLALQNATRTVIVVDKRSVIVASVFILFYVVVYLNVRKYNGNAVC